MSAPEWLTARPVAHRGLHDAAKGVIENTPSAAHAAIAAGYAIEVDLQVSADGEAMVHHDAALGRLNDGTARLDVLAAADLRRVPFKATQDRMIALGELCDLVAGRVTLLLELKSRFDRDRRLVDRTVDVLRQYKGAAAAMSFDPAQVLMLRQTAPMLTRGIVAEGGFGRSERNRNGAIGFLAYVRHALGSRPDFLAYSVRHLPATIPFMARSVFGLPMLTWTVRTQDDCRRAARWADQIIFEGFRP
jgi:glycerophosphoryl diester phosphodiesterase